MVTMVTLLRMVTLADAASLFVEDEGARADGAEHSFRAAGSWCFVSSPVAREPAGSF